MLVLTQAMLVSFAVAMSASPPINPDGESAESGGHKALRLAHRMMAELEAKEQLTVLSFHSVMETAIDFSDEELAERFLLTTDDINARAHPLWLEQRGENPTRISMTARTAMTQDSFHAVMWNVLAPHRVALEFRMQADKNRSNGAAPKLKVDERHYYPIIDDYRSETYELDDIGRHAKLMLEDFRIKPAWCSDLPSGYSCSLIDMTASWIGPHGSDPVGTDIFQQFVEKVEEDPGRSWEIQVSDTTHFGSDVVRVRRVTMDYWSDEKDQMILRDAHLNVTEDKRAVQRDISYIDYFFDKASGMLVGRDSIHVAFDRRPEHDSFARTVTRRYLFE
ncbi:MAG: hypothetical protein ACR2GY_04520 [Phycisphaerales bacterium]